ncbi:hypothetical protein [Burkholderia plantarii]|uniref:hypothetical protein n=1 Tax=Burkholderia plantarii TaxID=41899 RepID=UPI000ABD50F1|nr:hypothetical protein [Burkholderia plantarii]WLE61794.1 hypothetical protein GIY62_30630 [Burkholderia plantarii]
MKIRPNIQAAQATSVCKKSISLDVNQKQDGFDMFLPGKGKVLAPAAVKKEDRPVAVAAR